MVDTSKIRYIKDQTSGNTVNEGNYWVELQAFDASGTNVALNKTVTSSTGIAIEGTLALVTDGSTDTSPYMNPGGESPGWVMVDLGDLYDIRKIVVFHYYGDGRSYYNKKTMVSPDGDFWRIVCQEELMPSSSEGNSIFITAGGGYYGVE